MTQDKAITIDVIWYRLGSVDADASAYVYHGVYLMFSSSILG